MVRKFGSVDLVRLPRLDSTSAHTLGKEVLAAAKGRVLPEVVMEALDDVATTYRTLQNVAAASSGVREALESFGEALRHYIVCVAASVRRNETKTEVLAEMLLAPIVAWQTPRGMRPAEVAPGAEAGTSIETAAT